MTTTLTPLARAVLAAGLLAVLLGATLGTVPVHAASSVAIDARMLVGGRYEAGGWAAIAVTLVNEGSPTDGHLTAETDAGTMRRRVEMPAGARKVVTLYVRPGAFQRQLSVRYEEPNGSVEATVDAQALDVAREQVAIIGDPDATIRPQIAGRPELADTDPLSLTIADIPDRPEPLAGLAVLVWAGDGGALTEAQRRSIERWVVEGGQLVVLGGADWQARTAGLTDLLPVEKLGAEDDIDHAPLARWAGSDEELEPDTIVTGELRDGARSLVTTADGAPLASWHAVGAGRVVLFGSDLGRDAYRGWAGAPLLWSRVLETGSSWNEFFGGLPDRESATSSMAGALNTLPSLDVPPAELLLAVIVAYILLIGPVSYVVLRRLDRRELAWITAPVLILVFTASSYGIGLALKGTDVIVNQIGLLRSTPGGSFATVESYAGIFSPERATYDVLVDADALVAPMRADQFATDAAIAGSRLMIDQGQPARLHDLPIAARGFEYVRADAVVPHEAPLTVTWSYDDGTLIGTVTNVGSVTLTDVAFISLRSGEMIGDLAPGASGTFALDPDAIGQSAASDQVYGFGGFNDADPDRRRIAARREVINALVGYGGWMPLGTDLGSSDGRGPFLVGWRTGEGPSPITLEGVETRRFAELAEVVAVRPGLALGPLAIGPSQVHLTVDTDGGATVVQPGTVALGREPDAEAVFSISLPLEVSDMAVSSVEIVAGQDPNVVLEGGSDFPGLWPAGYLVEVWRTDTGEWTTLGDLNTASRFEIDEPATVVSAAGRIVVRVTAGAPDAAFGDPYVFISASIAGEIAP